MEKRKKRLSSISDTKNMDDIASLDSWTDALNNSSRSSSVSSESREFFRNNPSGSYFGSTNARKERARLSENIPTISKIEVVSKVNSNCETNFESEAEEVDLDGQIVARTPPGDKRSENTSPRHRSSTSSDAAPHTSKQPIERPRFFANLKNQIATQKHSPVKHPTLPSPGSSGSKRRSYTSLMSQSLNSGLDTPNGIGEQIASNYGHNYSPAHGYPSGQNNSYRMRTNTNQFGSEGSDLFANKLETESDKVKTRLQSAWNNMKYGWTLKTKTSFKNDSAIILLGKWYHVRPKEEESRTNGTHPKLPSLEEFKQDFSSRLWFTYRRDFIRLPGTKYTTDCGWGCMLRSGQCMIAQALVEHFLGRDWRIYNHQERDQEVFHREIIRWFSDISTDNSPFSIYKLVEMGKKSGKEPGDWYGPASVAHIFRDALLKAYRPIPLLSDVCIYVAQDCTVYKEDIRDLCTTKRRSNTFGKSGNWTEDSIEENGTNEWFKSVIILVPVRLGGEVLNEEYIPCVKQILSQEHCIGIIGGKPKHSLYFLGWQDDRLIYLDPHYCQDHVDTTEKSFPIQSFHCMSPRKLPMNKMDPSCTIGFYCRTERDFEIFERQIREMVVPKKGEGMYPLFVFDEGRGCDVSADILPEEQGYLRIRHVEITESGRLRSSTKDSEDFVIL